MKYKIKSMGALCALETDCHVNGISPDADDFVEKEDHSSEHAEDYACGDMRADVIEPTDEVLEKYSITKEEFAEVADLIATELSFGSCGWCV